MPSSCEVGSSTPSIWPSSARVAATRLTTTSRSSWSPPAPPGWRWPARSSSSPGYPPQGLPRNLEPLRASAPGRRRLTGAAAVRRQAWRGNPAGAQEARRGGVARRHDHRRRRSRHRGQVRRRPNRPDQRCHQDLGCGRRGKPAGADALGADRRAPGPGRTDRGQSRPHPAWAPRSSSSAT